MRISILLIALSIIALLSVPSLIVFGAQPAKGYVEYNVTLSYQNNSTNFTVNESAQAASQSGLVPLTLAITSDNGNLTYSRLINVSSIPEIFPYTNGLDNQSFSYANKGGAISVHIVNTGSSSISFNGSTYQATNYKLFLSASNSSHVFSAEGNIISMPSGLVYSLYLQVNGTTTIQAKLVSTDLSLASPSNSSTTVGVALVSAGVLGSFALAIPSAFKWRSKRKHDMIRSTPNMSVEDSKKEKPPYWVD